MVKTWPNWIDLIVVTILLRTCYSGFGRGLLAEVLNLVGAVGVTSLTVNYWEWLAHKLRPWLWVNPTLADFLVFAVSFLALIFMVHFIVRRITELLKWERLHWAIQGVGLVLGGLRGLWWSGVLLVVLTSSGVVYLRSSVEERSVLGQRLARVARDSLEQVADRFPGAGARGGGLLVPPIITAASAAPKARSY